jgi:hypothetical protein
MCYKGASLLVALDGSGAAAGLYPVHEFEFPVISGFCR